MEGFLRSIIESPEKLPLLEYNEDTDNVAVDEFNPEQFKLYENLDLFNMLNEDEAKECNISDDDDHDSDYIDPFDSGLRQKPKKRKGNKKWSRPSKFKRTNRSCGECKACRRTDDCMICKYCVDMRKYGGTGAKRQKCLLRQCEELSPHALLHKYDLEMAVASVASEAHPAVKDLWDVIYMDHSYSIRPTNVIPPEISSYVETQQTSSSQKRKKAGASKSKSHTSTRSKKAKPKKENEDKSSSFSYYDMCLPRRTRRQQDMYAQLFHEHVTEMQCLGPSCVYAARPGSKYCSDECGIELAKLRLTTFLPDRVNEWNATPCAATQSDEIRLEQLAKTQEELHEKLNLLDVQKKELEEVIHRARKVMVVDEPEIDAEAEADLDLQVHCITCGHAVGFKKALVHMERCYAKVESLITFGSSYKTRCEGESIFCEYFSRKQKTYCKRLRVLCPEHQKEPKVGPDEACGCPLSDNILAKHDDMDMCHLPKRTCPNHVGWERLRRAQIDLNRLQLEVIFTASD
ncbi:CXXC-type zinc finger protein 1-like isoform X2 [Corticium candelabrum]|uniref:CXXC-type zinc finger protein 1-like isoform X2 n=1 Tax=Corticium candelabrum TaxID=121492 RepID=UPI002E26E949|nr:CXXC-type zinc finger protein 1-like isoform X2 [Corticium candelabrum]